MSTSSNHEQAEEEIAHLRQRVQELEALLAEVTTDRGGQRGEGDPGSPLLNELKSTRLALHTADELARTTLYGIGDAVISTDAVGCVRIMNPVAELLTGWSEGEARGLPLDQVFPIINEESRAKVENPVARVLREGGIVGFANHTLLLSRDGTERPIADSGAPILGQHGEILGVVLVFRDQSTERAAEQALQAALARQTALLGSIPDIVVETDTDKVYTWANEAGRHFFGHDVVGHEAAFYFEGDQDTYGQVQPMFEGEERTFFVESWQRRQDGERRLLAWWCRALKDQEGAVTGALATARDITEERLSARQLKRLSMFLAALQSVNQLIVREHDPARLIVRVCEALVQTGAFTHSWIVLTDGKGGMADAASKDLSGGPFPTERDREDPACLEVLGHREVVTGEVLERCCRRCTRYAAHRAMPKVVVRLSSDGRIRGVMGLVFAEEFDVTDEHRGLLTELADDLDHALRRIEERKRREEAEAALRLSEEKFRYFFDHSMLGKSLTQPGGEVMVNNAFADMLGYPREELAGKRWQEITHPDDIEPSQLEFDRLLAKEQDSARFVKRYLRKDGTVVWTEVDTFVRWSADGSPLYFMTSVRDITSQRRHQETLSIRLRLFEFAADHTLQETLERTLDEIANITGSTAGFVHFLGPDQQTLSLQAWWSRTQRGICTTRPGSLHYSVEEAGIWADCIRLRRTVVHNDYASVPTRTGLPPGHIPVVRELVTPVFRGGRIVAIVGVGNKPAAYSEEDVETVEFLADVTWNVAEQKLAEERLRDSERRYTALFDSRLNLVFLHDLEGAFIDANDAALDALGLQRSDLDGLTLAQLLDEQQLARAFEIQREILERGSQQEPAEFVVTRRDGSRLPLEVVSTVVHKGGEPWAVAGVGRDLTSRNRAEAERAELQASLAQSDRLASMGMLAAGVAHEINNPLSYVLYNLESLFQDLPALIAHMRRCHAELSARIDEDDMSRLLGDQQRIFCSAGFDEVVSLAREALSGTHRIKSIARSLGTFSRVEQMEVGPVDVRVCVEHAIAMAYNEIKYRARLVKDFSQTPPVLASEGKLAQVFLNLLINAAHAIDEGHVESNEVRVRTWARGEEVFAEVSDSGNGIASEHLSRVFEPFFSTKPIGVGSGLGLSISRKIILDLGGDLTVTSMLGRGSRFLIRLPRVPRIDTGPREHGPQSAPEEPAIQGRILMVDDEEGLRRAVARMLSREHAVVTVASGQEAQDLLVHDRDFDVIYCDLMMPEMSGMELHSWLSEVDPGLAARVVFVTGGAFTPGAAEYLSRAGSLKIEKPFDAPSFKSMTRDLVNAVRARRGS